MFHIKNVLLQPNFEILCINFFIMSHPFSMYSIIDWLTSFLLFVPRLEMRKKVKCTEIFWVPTKWIPNPKIVKMVHNDVKINLDSIGSTGTKTQIYVCIYIFVNIDIYTHTHTHTHIYIYIYIYMYIYMYIYIDDKLEIGTSHFQNRL